MADEQIAAAGGAAVQVTLRRAMHVRVDPPHLFDDEIGVPSGSSKRSSVPAPRFSGWAGAVGTAPPRGTAPAAG